MITFEKQYLQLKNLFVFALLLLLTNGLSFAQDYSGTFIQQDDPSTVITLQPHQGEYVGTLLNEGTDEYNVQALVQGGYLQGLFSSNYLTLGFYAQLTAEGMNLAVAPVNEQGQIVESDVQAYVFLRQGETSTEQTTPNPLAAVPTQSTSEVTVSTDGMTTTPVPSAGGTPVGTTIAIGQQYAAGATLYSPQTGVTFTVPTNHTAFYDSDWGGIVLRAQDGSGILAMEAASHASAENLSDFAVNFLGRLLSGKSESDEIAIELVQGPVQNGELIEATIYLEGELISVATQDGAFGNSAVVFGYGPNAQVVVQELGRSFQFVQPNNQVDEWKELLAGLRLELEGGSSSSDFSGNGVTGSVSMAGEASYVYDFCGNGRFQYEFDDRTLASVGGAAGDLVGTIEMGDSGSYLGNWRLVSLHMGSPILVLETDDGEVVTHIIETTEQGAYFDKKQFVASQSPLCY